MCDGVPGPVGPGDDRSVGDLHAAILVRLGEIERAARYARGLTRDRTDQPDDPRLHWATAGGEIGWTAPRGFVPVATARRLLAVEHITLHDPAAVLRWAAWLRVLVEDIAADDDAERAGRRLALVALMLGVDASPDMTKGCDRVTGHTPITVSSQP